MFPQPSILLDYIQRDEFKLDESKIWPNFTVDSTVLVEVVGFFFVPGKILVAVGNSVDGLSEVPCAAIAKNSWQYQIKDTLDLCEQTV